MGSAVLPGSAPASPCLLAACKELLNLLGHLLGYRNALGRETWLLPPRWVAGSSTVRAKHRAQPGASSSREGKRGVVLVAKPGFISAGVLKVRGSSVIRICLWHRKEMCLSKRSLVTCWTLGDSNVAFSWLDKAHLAALEMPYFLKSHLSEFQSLYFMSCLDGDSCHFSSKLQQDSGAGLILAPVLQWGCIPQS